MNILKVDVTMVSSSISLLSQTHLPLNFFFVMRLTRLPQTHLPLYFFFFVKYMDLKSRLEIVAQYAPTCGCGGSLGS